MSGPCEESRDAPDVGDEEPCLCTCDGFFPVLGHAATPSEPREGAFDHPATRNDFEALCGVGAFDDLQRPAPDLLQSPPQLGPGIAAIGEYMTQQRVVDHYRLQQVWRAVAILNIGTMHSKA